MNTATSQHTGTARQPRADASADPQAKAAPESVAVLIRLPDLNRRQGSSPHSGPLPAVDAGARSPASSASPSPSAAPAAGRPQAAEGFGGEPPARDREQRTASTRRTRKQPPFDPQPFLRSFRNIPTAVWQIASAVAVLVLIILAVVSIRGGSKVEGTVDEPLAGGIADDAVPAATFRPEREYSVAALDPQRHRSGKEAAPPQSPGGSADRKSPQPLAGGAKESAAADQPATAEPSSAEPAAEKPANDKPPAGKPAADKPAADKPGGDKAAADKQAAENPTSDTEPPVGEAPEAVARNKPAEDRAADAAAAGAAAAADEPAAQQQQQPPQGQSPDVQPPQGQTPAAPRDPPRYYPLTNPATYQYPSDYERLFGGSVSGPAGAAGAADQHVDSQHRWQPGTARLQPAIEPPPMR